VNKNKEFLFGVATSAFQIEGNIENDFTEWEKLENFKNDFSDPKYENGSNHWKLWENDFELLKKLNVNSYRFSIEWSRIEPIQNQFDESAISQYHKMIDRLLEYNIEPVITIHHFTHPKWFHKFSPWTSKNSIEVFFNFARKVIEEFSGKIKYWVTFNEPLVWALASYGEGKFPPGNHDLTKTMLAIENILLAHIKVFDFIKQKRPNAKVGIAKHFIVFKEGRDFFLDKKLSKRINYFFNTMILEAFRSNLLTIYFPLLLNYTSIIELNNKIDFWGVNYYYRLHTKIIINYKVPFRLYAKKPMTDMGWEVYPKGLKKILKLVANYGKDIIITENGIATNDEKLRIKFIKKHLKIVTKYRKGKNILGYFYWSFIDNYEWLEGKSKRFGLVHVNYTNGFKRKIKPSGKFFANYIKKMIK